MIPTLAAGVWTTIGLTLVHVSWIAVVIGVAASITRRLMRRSSPDTRHAVALFGLIVLAVSPFLTFAYLYDPIPANRLVIGSTDTNRDVESIDRSPESSISLDRSSTFQTLVLDGRRSTRFRGWIDALPWIWLAGSSLTMAWLSVGLIGVGRIRRGATRLTTGPLVDRCRELAGILRVSRTVGLAVSARVASPMLVGLIRPTILLPASAITGWPTDLIELALIHELAHLRRLDNVTCLLQALVESILFFHPTTWWLSSWLRLERESCCDRIVVERTARPRAYADWLATMAGARRSPFSTAPALTEHPLTIRIRRILHMEDRLMSRKPTAPEAIALAVAGLLAATLSLSALAVQTSPKSQVLGDLRRLSEFVADQPKAENAGKTEPDRRALTLQDIAQAQVDRGDRSGALKTLESLKLGPMGGKPGEWDVAAVMEAGIQSSVAAIRFKAGDEAGGRASFRRLIQRFGEPDPERDGARIRALEQFLAEIAVETGPRHPEETVSIAVQDSKDDHEEQERESLVAPIELLVELARSLGELRELDSLRLLTARGLALANPEEAPWSSIFLYDFFGKSLLTAGDPVAGHDLIARGQAVIDRLPAGPRKDGMIRRLILVEPMADFAVTSAQIRSIPAADRGELISQLVKENCRIGPSGWVGPGGFGVRIAEPGYALKDPAGSRGHLKAMVGLAETVEGPTERARVLAFLARLLAQSGDRAAALKTAESIPDLRRAEAGESRNEFFESMKPATFATIARELDRNGDRSAADAAFARSFELTKTVADDRERLVCWIVQAQSLVDLDRMDQATAILADAIPTARNQPEPRRSRMLVMLAMIQLKAAGAVAVETTIDAIRDDSGLEKSEALLALARSLDRSGQIEKAREVARRGLACAEPRESDTAPSRIPDGGRIVLGPLDFDVEPRAEWLHWRRAEIRSALERIAPTDRPAGASPDHHRYQFAQVFEAYQRGGLDQALQAARAMESPELRADAVRVLAAGLANESIRK